jgi:hypothetical protein
MLKPTDVDTRVREYSVGGSELRFAALERLLDLALVRNVASYSDGVWRAARDGLLRRVRCGAFVDVQYCQPCAELFGAEQGRRLAYTGASPGQDDHVVLHVLTSLLKRMPVGRLPRTPATRPG